MKWSFLAGLLTSVAILSPISASAKAETLSSAHLISGKLVRSKFWSSVLGNNTKGDSQQVMQREAQAKVLTLDTLGRGGEGVKAKSPDALQLSRGLGSGGGEGGGSPSQHAPAVNTKDISLPGRPMLASQNALTRDASVDGERGPSLTSGSSRSAVASFSMPTPVSITVGQHSSEGEGASGSHSRGSQSRPQVQETSSSSPSPSHSAVSEGSSSEALSSGGSVGGGGGGSSASQEGVLLKPDAVKEYQKLKTEKAQQLKIPAVPSIPVVPVGVGRRVEPGFESLSSEALEQAKMALKKVAQQKSSSQPAEASLKDASLKTVSSSGKGEGVKSSVETKSVQKATTSNLLDSRGKSSGNSLLSGGTDDIPLDILQAAEALGFKLAGNYKDEAEAKRALGNAFYTKDKNLNNELERTNPTTDAAKYNRLMLELEALTSYKTSLLKYFERKYDKRNPNEEEIRAAEALGFKLTENHKDEADAKKALARVVYTKDKNLNSELERTNPTTDAVKYNRLALELAELDGYKTSLMKYLARRYAVAKKGFGSIKVSGSDWKAQLQAFGQRNTQTTGGGKTTKKAPTLKELGDELTALAKAIQRAQDDLHAAVVADEDDTMKELTAKIAQLKNERLEKIIAYDKKREEEKPSATKKSVVVKVDPQKALKEQEDLRLFKQQNPALSPVLDILSPADQTRLLNRKMTIFYDTNSRKQVPEKKMSQGKVVQGATEERLENVVAVLNRLSPTQRQALLDYVKNLESGARLSALAFTLNYTRNANYQFPDLARPVPVVKAKKAPTAKATTDVVVGAKKPVAPKQPEAPKKTIKERQQELLLQGNFKMKLPVKGSGQKDPNDP